MLSTFVSVVKLMCMDRIHVVGQKYNSALEGSCSDIIGRFYTRGRIIRPDG